ncbi:hypothetical protein BA190_31995 [Labrys sp. WJW]|nr:hypothetical protein BA190_31995 [Labrys sp. WJW]
MVRVWEGLNALLAARLDDAWRGDALGFEKFFEDLIGKIEVAKDTSLIPILVREFLHPAGLRFVECLSFNTLSINDIKKDNTKITFLPINIQYFFLFSGRVFSKIKTYCPGFLNIK